MKKLSLILMSVFTILGIFGAGADVASSATGAALYSSYCSSCHPGNTKQGATTARIDTAINSNTGGMGSLSFLTATDRQAIAVYLGGASDTTTADTTVAATSTTTTAAGTTTTGAALYTGNCVSCHGSAGNLSGSSASGISNAISRNKGGMGRLASLTSSQIQAIADYMSTVSCSNVQTTANTGSIATFNTNTGTLDILSLLAGNSTYTATLTYEGTCASSFCFKLTSAAQINNSATILMVSKKSDDNESGSNNNSNDNNESENESEDDDIKNSCTESSVYDSNSGALNISSVEVDNSSYHVSLEYYGACDSSETDTCFIVTAVRQNL